MIHNKPKIFFVATVEFAVNAFLLHHLKVLSNYFEITLVVNTHDKMFLKKQGLDIRVIPLQISRNINLLNDLLCLLKLSWIFIKDNPSLCVESIKKLVLAYKSLSEMERVYMVVASYLLFIYLRRFIFFSVLRVSARKSLGLGLLQLLKDV